MLRRRRVNYTYLRRLSDRLRDMGHDILDWPHALITDGLWPEHRDYIKTELGLRYCVRCKLPCLEEEMDSGFTDICTEHAATFRHGLEERDERALTRRLGKMEGRSAIIVKTAIDRGIEGDKVADSINEGIRDGRTQAPSLDFDAFHALLHKGAKKGE